MAPLWQSLFANVALVAILVVLWDFMSEWTGRLSHRLQSLLLGVIMGGGAVVSMAMAQPLLPGFVFDLRAPIVATAAFFGGIPAVVVAGTAALLYRVYLGGMGMPAGIVDLLIACLVGLAGYWWTQSRPKTTRVLLVFSLVVAFARLIAYVAVPADIRLSLLARTGIPLVSLTFVSSVLITLVLQWQARRRDLSTSNLIYRAMVRELPDCLNIKDKDGRFLAANQATASLMQADTVESLIGKSDFDFYPSDLAKKFRQDEIAMLRRGEPRRIDQEALFPDGTRGWLSTLKVPFRNAQGRVVGIITHNRDITEMKQADQVKAEFIATVSHELRTPLTSIRGSLGLVSAGVAGELPPKAARLVKIAHDNSERLVLLINDILDIEKIESGKMQFDLRPTPIRDLVESVISNSANYLPERQIRTVLVDDAPRAQANIDPDRLHQVFANLMSNAIKFSPVGGTVTVKIERRDPEWIRISVIDEGPGIPDAFHEQIFEKFAQVDASDTREKGGTGLGLSIAKAIVERLDGRIGFDTKMGVGTGFYVDLAEFVPPKITAETPVEVIDHRRRVLICEDEAEMAAVIATTLDAEGFSSDVASDATSAIALLQQRDYIASTLDIRLAGESGLELLHRLRQSTKNSDIPVIFISAVANETKATLNGADMGIVEWLQKPVEPQRLREALSRIAANAFDPRPKILHVEDDESVLQVMAVGLGTDVSITSARSLAEARQALAHSRFDVVILDVGLPDGSGIGLLPDLPAQTAVIIFSATEIHCNVHSRVNATVTKTRSSELDVARLVRSFLPRSPQLSGPIPSE